MAPSAALTTSSIVVASHRQVSCEVGEEAVLLSIEDGEYYGLNPVGAAIWRHIQEPRSVAAVRDRLLAEFSDVDPATCEAEVLAFLAELLEVRLVEVEPSTKAAAP